MEADEVTRSWGSLFLSGEWTAMGSQDPLVETIAYVWGCGPSSLPLFRDGGTDAEAARRAAMANGWDPAREGAWAREIRLPARHSTALLALSAEALRDPAVEGFQVA
jgi:hypothetical protein